MRTQRDHPKVYAIFEGGGVKGSAHVGALAEALHHVDVIGVGGTSAGAIVAALFAAGYEPDEMLSLMEDLNYRKLAKPFLFRFPRRYGLRSSKYIYEWLSRKLAQKVHPGSDHPVTFGDRDLRCPIKIVAADIRNRRRKVFSREHDFSTEIAHAVRLSMSIPFFYESLQDPSGRYVDGGIISNFPLWLFDEERRQPDCQATVLGFDLVETAPDRVIRGWRSFAQAVLDTSLAEQRRLLEEHLDHPLANTIRINTGTVATTDFDIATRDIRTLHNLGRQAAELFFATSLKPVGPRSDVRDLTPGAGASPAEVIRALALNHLYSSQEATNVGTYSDVVVRYYVDFMEACLVPPALAALTGALAQHVRSLRLSFDVIAGPKRGNPIFVASVAAHLHVKPLLVKDDLNSRFGYPFEGLIRRGERVLVVDDISSDGHLLAKVVSQLRMHGQTVNDVVALINRPEGNALQVLSSMGCTLHSVVTADDKQIATWLEHAKGFNA